MITTHALFARKVQRKLSNGVAGFAARVEPNRSWRIITSDEHSTVWDGKDTLFDFNFLALGVTAAECFDLAHKKELAPGRHHKVHLADHWTSEHRTVRPGPSPQGADASSRLHNSRITV